VRSNSSNSSALITGGSRGIGEACARAFVEAGGSVVICARKVADGEKLAAELNARWPGRCHYERCDVSDPDQVQHVVEKTVELYGRLDCLINNAGRHPDHHPIDEFSAEEFEELLRTNLVSYFAAAKYALPHLRKTKGSIINMSSLVGDIGQEWATTYCATKGGITAFTKALAVDEARHGVRVNAVSPGNVATPLYWVYVNAQQDWQAVMDLCDSWQWMGRLANPEEVANACLFLASDGASFVTGIELLVTGGAELAYGIKRPSEYMVNTQTPSKQR